MKKDKSVLFPAFLSGMTLMFFLPLSAQGAMQVKAWRVQNSVASDPKVGEKVQLQAEISGGKAPYTLTWRGATAIGPRDAEVTYGIPGHYTIALDVEDAQGEKANTNFWYPVMMKEYLYLKAGFDNGVNSVLYSGKAVFRVHNLPEFKQTTPIPEYSTYHDGGTVVPGCNPEDNKGKSSFDEDLCLKLVEETGKVVHDATATRVTQPSTIVSQNSIKYPPTDKFIYLFHASEERVERDPIKSNEGHATVTFNNIGRIKVWAQILNSQEHLIGETDRVEMNVTAPVFRVNYSTVGSEVKVNITSDPAVDPTLMQYSWVGADYNQIASKPSEGTLRIQPGKTSYPLEVTVQVPHPTNKEIATVKAEYQTAPESTPVKSPVKSPGCDFTSMTSSGRPGRLFNNIRGDYADNGGQATKLKINKACVLITRIETVHWNNGKGATPGTIGLIVNGVNHGPWQARGETVDGVGNVKWIVEPKVEIVPKDGEEIFKVQVIDSDAATWSQNEQTKGRGMTEIQGYIRGE